jgi:mannose-6-phosphate isomerase-like protein (cupin superfamily)
MKKSDPPTPDLSGEVVLRLDNGEEQLLKPGDLVVQKGATHTWNNFTKEPCDLLGIMIGADSFDP